MITLRPLDRALSLRADESHHAAFLDRVRTERSSGDDLRGRIALGEYLLARLIDRMLASDGSDEAEDGIRWHLETTGDYIATLPEEDPETTQLAAVMRAARVEGLRRLDAIRAALAARARFLMQEQRDAEAIEVLRLAASTMPGPAAADFPAIALAAGEVNLHLDRLEQAGYAYLAAEEAAFNAGDAAVMLRARIGEIGIARRRGDLARARAGIEQVITEASGHPDLDPVAAEAYVELGATLASLGRPVDALRALFEAFCRTAEPADRTAVLCLLGDGLAEQGAYDAAASAFVLAERSAPGPTGRARALLGLMDLASNRGDRIGFERHRSAAGAILPRTAPHVQVDFAHRSAVGLARFGQFTRAAAIWQRAAGAAAARGLADWERSIERMLSLLPACRSVGGAVHDTAMSQPELAVLSADIRQLAALAGA